MSWLERNVHWVMLILFVVLAYVIVGFLGLSAVVLLAGAVGGASLGALLGDAAVVVGLTALMVLAEVALAVAFVKNVVQRASFPTSRRLATLCSVLETVVPPLRGLGLSRRFRPSVAERKRAIKDRYVAGELTEREFEREMADLLDEVEPEPSLVRDADPLDSADPVGETSDRIDESRLRDLRGPESRREPERE